MGINERLQKIEERLDDLEGPQREERTYWYARMRRGPSEMEDVEAETEEGLEVYVSAMCDQGWVAVERWTAARYDDT